MQSPAGSGPTLVQVPLPPESPAFADVMPTAVWRGAVAARRELNNQRISLQDQRRRIAEQLRNPVVGGPDRQGLEQQITGIDAGIAALDREIAAANARVASTALVPGAVVEDRRDHSRPSIDDSVLTALFIVAVLFPLSVAMAIRFLRRGATTIGSLPREMMERFDRLDQAVDAMAVEVERIGESQRFVTRLMSERPASEQLALERGRTS